MAWSPPDSDERLFLKIVEAGSLKAAAQLIGSDPSAISRRLAMLEARLGQQLLRRSTRGSTPTEAGARYYEGLSQIIAQQDALEAVVAQENDAPQGRLRVTAPPEFGVRFVVPVLEALQREHPSLAVELSLGTSFADLAVENIDVAIRIGTLRDSALRARRLGNVPRIMVGAPSYLDAHGEPTSHTELAGHRFMSYVGGPNQLRLTGPDGKAREIEVAVGFAVNSIVTLVRQVEAGAGLLYGPLWSFAESLRTGRVRQVLADYRFDAAPIHALYLARHYQPAKTRVFIDAMLAQVAAEPSLDGVI